MQKEVWKFIPGYEGKYIACTNGKIKSLIKNRDIIGKKLSSKGYRRVNLDKRVHFAHRLIAVTFIVKPHDKTAVNHKNGIKTDNRVENLEWVTNKQNSRHAMKLGLLNITALIKNKKIFESQKKQMIKLLLTRPDLTQSEIASRFGVRYQAVSKLAKINGIRRLRACKKSRRKETMARFGDSYLKM